MDRREALKKLGVGGAAVAGTSMVLSSPAFALDEPAVTGVPATFTLTKTSGSAATIAASGFPAGTCPASATNDGDVPSQGAPSFAWTAPTAPNDGTGVTVTRTQPTGGNNWDIGDIVTVTVTVAYTCQYVAGPATRSYSWSRTFTSDGNGGGGNFNGGSISGPTAV